MELTWKYKIELKDEKVFFQIEKERGIVIPSSIKELIRNTNASTPSKYNFLIGATEKVLGAILSFNYDESDTDTVFTALNVIKDKNLLPFAIDPFGNYICYDIPKSVVVFWNHETNTVSSTNMDLDEFLSSLY